MPVTIKDVAKQAGVAVSTVSRVLSGNPRISAATTAKVKAVIKELGYQPNNSARSLSLGEANQVGVIFPVNFATAYPNDGFQLQLLQGINQELQHSNTGLSVAIAPDWQQLLVNVQKMIDQAQIHHFIVLYATVADPITQYLRRRNQNFVVIGTPPQQVTAVRYIDNDNRLAGYQVTQHFIKEHALHHPLFVMSDQQWMYEENRHAGFCQAVAEHDLPQAVLKLVQNHQTTAVFWEQLAQCDGIVAASDEVLLQLAKLLPTRSPVKRLPALCFNVNPLLTLVWGTVVVQVDLKPHELGINAVRLLTNARRSHQLIGFALKDNF